MKRKRQSRKKGSDRISELPSEILFRILSFLDMKEVVRTSLISKSWRYTWCSVPNLKFNDHNWDTPLVSKCSRFVCMVDKHHKFTKFVDQALLLRNNSDSSVLSFCLSLEKNYDCDKIDRWIDAAVSRHVKEVDLNIGANARSYTLPKSLFNSTITSIKLSSFVFPTELPSSVCSATHLRTLMLKRARFPSGDSENKLNIRFSLLEDLALLSCSFGQLKVINIAAPHLKSLAINDLKGMSYDCTIRLCAPNLTSFKFDAYHYERYNLEDLSLLVNVDICIATPDYNPNWLGMHFEDMIRGFSTLHNATNLKLSTSHFYQVGRTFPDIVDHPNPFYNIRRLELSWTEWSSTRVISYLLRNCPSIENLVLEVIQMSGDPSNRRGRWKTENVNWGEELHEEEEYVLDHLRLVNVNNFRGQMNELAFIRYLLERAVALKKLKISVSKKLVRRPVKLVNLKDDIHDFHRASPSVEMFKRNSF